MAWGDVNGDGYLDLAVGNSGYQNDRSTATNQVYLNSNGMLATTPSWTSGVLADTRSVAWGDADGDGDLDLAVANVTHMYDPAQGIQIYLNSNGVLETTPTWTVNAAAVSVSWADYGYNDGRLELVVGNPTGVSIYEFPSFYARWGIVSYPVHSVALGDADNDGDLDIAVGGSSGTSIYLTGADGYPAAEGQVVGSADTRSVAWGDVDGDGDLDLAMGNVGGPSQLYVNDLPLYTYASGPCFRDSDISSLALGDVDNDGDLDLAVGFAWGDQPNVAYRNANGNLYSSIIWTPDANIHATSLAWGDVDGDGYLDMAVGNQDQPTMVYRNQGGTLSSAPYWTAAVTQFTYSVAWGDMDGDGDLDLAAGKVVYLNLGTTLQITPVWTDTVWGNVRSVAWGDMDGDGDLDLALGIDNGEGGARVYLNANGRLQTAPIWAGGAPFETQSVAWGDVDNDGDLDLALGHYDQPNRIFLNENGRLQTTPIWQAARREMTLNLSWVDTEIDGDVDLMAGTTWSGYLGNPWNMLLYPNLGGALHPRAVTLSSLGAAIAWGPLNGDRLPDGVGHRIVPWCGDPPVASAALNQVLSRQPPAHPLYPTLPVADVTLFLTNTTPAAGYATTRIWGETPIPFSYTLASDGAVPSVSGYYSLNGGGKWLPARPTTDTITRNLVILGRALAFNGTNQYYGNITPLTGGDFTIEFWFNSTQVTGTADHWEHGMGLVDSSGTIGLGRDDYGISLAEGKVLFGVGSSVTTDTVVVGPFAADGRWHYVAATRRAADGALTLYLDGAPVASGIGSTANRWSSSIYIGRSALLVGNYYQGQMDEIRLWNTVRTPEEIQDSFRTSPAPTAPGLAAYYRGNEAGVDGTFYSLFDSSPNRNHFPSGVATRVKASLDYVYRWDVLGGGFLGQSDNVIFRLVAQPGVTAPPNGVPGPYQRPAVAASTFPLRVRGSQVRVLQNGNPVAGAMVYRIPLGQQTQGSLPYMDLTGQPYRTNPGGYLGGYGEMDFGDQLVALVPITATDTYTLTYTSAAPSATGLEAHTVLTPGVQTLVISSANSLVLFPLEVSLEWDARADAAFLEQLDFDFRRASEFLYDWSNGQAALGAVHIYHAREHWDTADIRIYASNRMRPSAIQGGVTRTRIEDPDVPTLFYGCVSTLG